MKKRTALKVMHRVHAGALYPMKTMLAAARRLKVELLPYVVHQIFVFDDGQKGRVTSTLYQFGGLPKLGEPHILEGLQEAWWAAQRLDGVVEDSPDSP